MLADHEQVRVANVALVRRFIEAINDSWNIEVMREYRRGERRNIFRSGRPSPS